MNIIVNHPTDVYSVDNLQTDDPRVQLKCNKTLPIKVIKLLDCFGNKSVTEFVLKVSRFPEIASLPSFHSEIPVYFVDDPRVQLKCNKTLPIKVIKLLDCFGNKSVTEFVLKVSRFPEIASLPSFHSEIPVYFVVDLFSNTSISPQLKTTQIHYPLNDSSNLFWNQEYKVLLLPATLAFFTLISIQIILCGLWFSNSITQKLMKCFKKHKYKHHNVQLQTNDIYKNYQIDKDLNRSHSIQSNDKTTKLPILNYETKSNVNLCCQSKPSLLINKYNLNNIEKQQNSLNSHWLIHFNQFDNDISFYKFNDQQSEPNVFRSNKSEKLLFNFQKNLIHQTIPDTSTILCNCINQSNNNMKLRPNQELLIPVSIYLNKNIMKD
ncbi:uncharacterized protein DC041_0001068 [Schistosoma bovis]|uniref:Uncharacterized protein n=1 Tax=Schistosoma bovis TaxID=6184 RepID=A0A430QTL4_SCHBO|nr:uncharacterized protein DC041_0001068 [Schistosoma bovis]